MGAALVKRFSTMPYDQLEMDYFNWIYDTTSWYLRNTTGSEYINLYKQLDSINFVCVMPLDENRAADGVDLRDHFGYIHNIDPDIIRDQLDTRPCSVLEMMAALAYRCEVSIMQDSDYGDRTSFWFYEMLVSLGVARYDDRHYTSKAECEIDDIINAFLDRDYDTDGRGGLFTIEHPSCDIRDVEIWYQMNMHLNEIIEKE